jgi:hypothetical protein
MGVESHLGVGVLAGSLVLSRVIHGWCIPVGIVQDRDLVGM